MEIVKMEHVTKIYGEGNTRVWALDDVNLTVNKGEIVAVVGASGSGKSTLLHVMGGVDIPNEGNVIVDGKDITRLTDEEMSVFRRRKIGFVFQAYHLIPVLTVEENIKMPILLDHRKPDRDYIDHIIEMLGLKDRRKHLPNQLSGGQQQRAAIARALANRPALILAMSLPEHLTPRTEMKLSLCFRILLRSWIRHWYLSHIISIWRERQTVL